MDSRGQAFRPKIVGNESCRHLSCQLHEADSAGTLPKPCNAGFTGFEWILENFTESEVRQSRRSVVLDLQKVPLQAFLSVPADSVRRFVCNVKVNFRCKNRHGELTPRTGLRAAERVNLTTDTVLNTNLFTIGRGHIKYT